MQIPMNPPGPAGVPARVRHEMTDEMESLSHALTTGRITSESARPLVEAVCAMRDRAAASGARPGHSEEPCDFLLRAVGSRLGAGPYRTTLAEALLDASGVSLADVAWGPLISKARAFARVIELEAQLPSALPLGLTSATPVGSVALPAPVRAPAASNRLSAEARQTLLAKLRAGLPRLPAPSQEAALNMLQHLDTGEEWCEGCDLILQALVLLCEGPQS